MGDTNLRLLDRIAKRLWGLPFFFRVVGSFLVYVGLPLALIFAVVMGGYLLLPRAQSAQPLFVIGNYERAPVTVETATAAATGQDAYKDVLQTVLAVAALSKTIFGFGAYTIVRVGIEGRVERLANARSHRAIAASYNNFGYHYWLQYSRTKDSGEPDVFFLDRAIELTKQAYNNHAKELDETEREMERLIATIRNNLASYIATLQKQKGRVAEGDRLLAEGCARYIKARIHTFPDKAATWELTLKEVRESFPDADL